MQFDNLINSLLKEEELSREDRIKALKNMEIEALKNDKPHSSPYEHDITYEEDFPQVEVDKYIQDATSNEDLFILQGTVSVGYTIIPGQNGGRTDPSWGPYPEIEDLSWYNVELIRYKPDGTSIVVNPYEIGVPLYKTIVRDLKQQAEPHAIKETESYLEDRDNWSE